MRCQNCRELFTVRGVLPLKIADSAERSKCPHCGHEPGDPLASPVYSGTRHLIVTLEREKEDA